MSDEDLGEVIFEFKRSGQFLRLTAMHADSLTEVVVVGPMVGGAELMRRTALQKLRYVLSVPEAERHAPAPVFIGTHQYGPEGKMRKPPK